jgi:hypothetical protein
MAITNITSLLKTFPIWNVLDIYSHLLTRAAPNGGMAKSGVAKSSVAKSGVAKSSVAKSSVAKSSVAAERRWKARRQMHGD